MQNSLSSDQGNKYNYLGGLRGVLALIVVISHFILLFSPVTFIGSFDLADFKDQPWSFKILLANSPLNVFMNGNWAVCMFFILSGYVLSLKYFKTGDVKILQSGAIKRYFRLVIPILCICLCIYLLHITGVFENVFYPRNAENYNFGRSVFLKNLSLPATFKMALFDVPINANSTFLPVLWTMQTEFIGALILFSFMLITHSLNKKWLFYLVTVITLFITGYNYLVLFFAGSFIANYEEKLIPLFKNKFLRLILLVSALYLAGIPNIEDQAKAHTIYSFTTFFPKTIVIYFHVLSCVCLFSFFISGNYIKKIFSLKPLLTLGRLSFSLYLVHLPVLFIVGSYLLQTTKGGINFYLLFSICFVCCILLSYIFYRLVDAKSISISNKIAKIFV